METTILALMLCIANTMGWNAFSRVAVAASAVAVLIDAGKTVWGWAHG